MRRGGGVAVGVVVVALGVFLPLAPAGAADSQPVIVLEPVDLEAFDGGRTTISAAIPYASSATAPTVVWEFSADGSTWSPSSGTANIFPSFPANQWRSRHVLFLSPATAGFYRARFTNSVGSAVTRSALITLLPPMAPEIVLSPSDQLDFVGGTLQLRAEAMASGSTQVEWEHSTDGGATWTTVFEEAAHQIPDDDYTDVSSRHELYVDPTTVGLYRATFTNDLGSATTEPAEVTLAPGTAPTIVTPLANKAVALPLGIAVGVTIGPATFSGVVTGHGWSYVNYPGGGTPVTVGGGSVTATSASLSIASGTSTFDRIYTLRLIGPYGVATTSARVTRGTTPNITSQPASRTVTAGTPASFTVGVSGFPDDTRWERSDDGGATWTTVQPLGTGTAARTYTLADPTEDDDGAQLRAVVATVLGTKTSAAATLTVLPPSPQTITFPALPVSPPVGSSAILGATASSGLPVSYAASGSCTVADGAVSFTSVGACSVTASQAGGSGYAPAADVTLSTTVTKAEQTITFTLPDAPPVGRATLEATASSGLAVSYSASGGCTVSSNVVTYTSAGVLCTITARQNGNAAFLAATPVARTVVPVPGPQTITLGSIPSAFSTGDSHTLTARASSGLPVSLTATGPCTLAGMVLTAVGPGTCVVTAEQAGDANWLAAPPRSASRIIKAEQTITFSLPDAPPVGRATLTGTSSAGLTVTYLAAGGCTVSGRTVTYVSAGVECTITARQTGTSAYLPATPVARTVVPVPGPQTVRITSLPAGLHVGDTVAVVASASSGLPVTLVATGACTVSGATLTIVAPGTCAVTVSQEGSADYTAATSVTTTRFVKADQVLTFPELPDAPLVGSSTTLAATTSAPGLTVRYSVAGGCSLSGKVVTFTAPEECSVTATQAGSSTYHPAAAVTRSTTPVAAP